MNTINSNALLEQLQNDVRAIILHSNRLEAFTPEQLLFRSAPGKWNIAQVLEHLNIYARYYINAMEQKLHGQVTTPKTNYTPGWLGNYFTRLMKPTANKTLVRTMKSPKNAVPSEHPNAGAMLSEFIQHQHHLLNLLRIAQTANIGRLRIATSLSKLITLKLGDTFRFFIAHEQRHFLQIEHIIRILKEQQQTAPVPA